MERPLVKGTGPSGGADYQPGGTMSTSALATGTE